MNQYGQSPMERGVDGLVFYLGKTHYSVQNTIVLAGHKHKTCHVLESTKFGGKKF